MYVLTLPFKDNPLGIIGFTYDELGLMMMGKQPPFVDFSDNFTLGIPLPSVVQVIVGKDQETILARVQRACEALGVPWDADTITPVPQKDKDH
jgi:hypothetical protein